ncbi:putative outer membrane efflux protein [Prevotella sp. CAG:1320]|nr:putative outer membrane efflux protein [Prevotella sp. CAG:1320]
MRKFILLTLMCALTATSGAQTYLSLDSCKAMALRNNKQLNISRLSKEVAKNVRKAARTKYLPKVDAMGGYLYTSKQISIISGRQRQALGSLGTSLGSQAQASVSDMLSALTQQGILTPDQAEQLGGALSQTGQSLGQAGNKLGQKVADAFDTDTRHMWAGAVMVRQPIYMGGAIKAANKIADIGESMADDDLDLKRQATLYGVYQAYWTTVSLEQKRNLALSYKELVEKLSQDVKKMITQGVATKADGLRVDVRVNEADMQLTQVVNGLSLAKMLLCQLCGLPLNEDIQLTDSAESKGNASALTLDNSADSTYSDRPEIRLLEHSIAISEQTTNLIRAGNLPKVSLVGGYMTTNPSVYDGFRRRFSGVWNVGVIIQVPIWDWFDTTYKIRASKAATNIAKMELSDAREKVELQVTQSQYKMREAQKRLAMASQNIKSAEENLRCANLGFREGVMGITEVMEAQTAWQLAQSQKIDAEVEVKLSELSGAKALGTLR